MPADAPILEALGCLLRLPLFIAESKLAPQHRMVLYMCVMTALFWCMLTGIFCHPCRLHLVDKFEHCQVKLGDKMFYTIKEGDSIGTQTPHHSHFPCLCPTNEATDFTDINRSTEELLSMVADGTSHHDPGPLASENCHFDAIAVS